LVHGTDVGEALISEELDEMSADEAAGAGDYCFAIHGFIGVIYF
jgi:hypothetical protein